jgi:hypothetical protein
MSIAHLAWTEARKSPCQKRYPLPFHFKLKFARRFRCYAFARTTEDDLKTT